MLSRRYKLDYTCPLHPKNAHSHVEYKYLSRILNREDKFLNMSQNSTPSRDDYERSIREHFLSLKSFSFLHNQSDYIMASAPIRRRILNL